MKARSIVLFAGFAAGLFVALFLAGPAQAQQTLTWDATGSGSPTDGGGSWTLTGSNWWNGTNSVPWVNANAGLAQFGTGSGGSTAYGVTLSQATTANGIIFQDHAYTLSGDTLTLVGTTPTITVNSAAGATIDSVLAGSAGLTKAGPGTLTLNAANTYTGGTMVNAGTLQFSSSAAATGTITVNRGGLLHAFNVPNAFNGATINLNGGTVNIGRNTSDYPFPVGGNFVVKANSQLDSYNSAVGVGYDLVHQFGTLDFAAADPATHSHGYQLNLTDKGIIWNYGPTGVRSRFTGSIIGNSGAIQFTVNARVQGDSRGLPTLEFENTAIRAGKTVTVTQAYTADGYSAANLIGSLGVATLGGAEFLTSDTITMFTFPPSASGGYQMLLTDTSTFDTTNGLWSKSGTTTGTATTINATLASPKGSISAGGNLAFTAANVGDVALTGLGVNGLYQLQLTLANSSAQSSVIAQLAKNPAYGNIAAVGTSQVNLSFLAPASTTYFAWDNVHSSLGNGSWYLGDNLTGVALATQQLQFTWSSTSNSSWSNSANWVNGVPQGSADTAIFGSGTQNDVQLGNTNATLGYLTFSNSNVSYTIAQGSGSGSITMLNLGSTVQNPGSVSAVVAVTAGSHTISAPLTLASNTNFSIAAGQQLTLSGPVGGAGNLTTTDSGTLVLSGSNTYAGSTTVNAGTLQVGNVGAIPHGSIESIVAVGPTGTLDLAGNSITINGITGAGVVTTSTTGTAILTVGDADTSTDLVTTLQDGRGQLGLGKIGAGTLTLYGSNSYSGPTNLLAGTVVLNGNSGGSNCFGQSAGTVTIAGGVTIRAKGPNGYDNPIAFANPVSLSGGTVTVDENWTDPNGNGNQSLQFDGPISGPGSLLVTGDLNGGPRLYLTHANTFSGGVVMYTNGGGDKAQLHISNVQALGTGTLTAALQNFDAGGNGLNGLCPTTDFTGDGVANPIQIVDGKYFAVSCNNFTMLLSGNISGGGQLYLNQNTGGTLILSGSNNTYSGGTTIAGGTLQVGNGGTTGSLGSGPVANYGVLAFSRSDSFVVANDISGAGNLVMNGAGSATLTGSNTYTGTTTVSSGTLALGSGGSIVQTPTIALANGTTFDVSALGPGYHLTSGQTLTGAGSFSVAGAMTVDSGATLQPGGPTNVGSLTVGTLTLNTGSITNFKITNPSNLDQFNVTSTGGLTINGGGINLYQPGGTTPFAVVGTYDLFQYSGTSPSVSGLSVLDQVSGFRYGFGTANGGGNNYVALTIGAGPVWTGSGSISNWSDAANWTTAPIQGDTLIFDGNSKVSNSNGTSITQFSSLVFNPTAGSAGTGFTLSGNAITLVGDSYDHLINNLSPTVTHTINLPITVGAAGKTITTSDPTGRTVLGGAINNNGNSVIFSGSGNTTIGPAGGISGNGGLTKNGPGTLAINAATTYKGDTLVVAGALSVGHSLALQNSTLDTSGSGTVNLNVLAATLGGIKGNGNLTIPSGGTLSVGNNDASTAYSGSLGGNGGLTKTGSGTLTVTATQGYTGATAITGNGTLKLQGALTSPPVPGYTYHFDAAYLGMTDGTPVTQWNNGGSVVGNAVVPSANQNVPPTYLADAGTGTHLGALAFAGNGGAASSSALQFPEDSSIRTLFSIFKGSSFLMTDIASGSYNFHRNGANIDGDPADPLWEGPSGSGWTSDNITSGTTSVNGVVADWSQTNMPINLHNGYNLVALQTTDNVQADSFNCDRGDTHAGDQSQAEVIIYDRPLTPTEMSQVSAYLNSKWFIGGGGSNLLPTGTALSIDLGSTLDLNGASQQIGLLTGSGTVTNTGGADATLTFSSGTSSIFGGVISDGPTNKTALTVSGGTLTLAGVNTFSGTTSVTGGMLAAGTLGALSASSDVTITGGTLSTRAFAQTVNSLTVGAEGTLNLYIGHLLTATNLSSLDGTLTLSGIANGRVELMNFPNGYTGTFANPSGYTLVYLTNEIDVIGGASHWKLAQSGNWSATGNWQGSVPSGNGAQAAIDPPTGGSNYTITLDGAKTVGTLEFGNSNSTTSGYTLSGTDTLTLNNSGTATITVTNGKHGIAVPVVLENDLAVSGSGTLTFSSSISGIGKSLTLNGPGTLILSGTGLYTGGTIVNAGTLAVTSSTALPDNQSLTVGAGGTLIFDPSYVASSIIATPISAASYAVSPVPEPSTLALLAAGLAVGFGAWRRKKK